MARKHMDREQMQLIAEQIARDPKSYPSARITALRFLKEFDTAGEEDAKTAFSELDEMAPRCRAT
jgi:hypothetical protein